MATFITNRTSADVERWRTLRDKGWSKMKKRERSEWMGEINVTPSAARGMYTHNDLNRVERAVNMVVARFKEAGYIIPDIVTRTSWSYRDRVTVEDMERYYSNIAVLREFLLVYPGTPNPPSIDKKLDYELANDIEKILENAYRTADGLVRSSYYTGEVMSGEV